MSQQKSIYRTFTEQLPNISSKKVLKQAHDFHKTLINNPRRKPFIRSYYFGKRKIFLTLFWTHVFEKNLKVRSQRLRLFPCAIELLKRSTQIPETKKSAKQTETLFRFMGVTPHDQVFVVQVKQRSHSLYLVSVYPKK